MENSEIHSYIWRTVFPLWLTNKNFVLICNYSFQQNSIGGQKQYDKQQTA